MNNAFLENKLSPYKEGMYFLFPLLFSQLIAVHVAIGFSPHILFGLGIIYFYGSINRNHLLIIITITFFLLISAFSDSAFKQAIQISIELIYGYLIANFFISRYSMHQLRIFFKNCLLIWAILIFIFFIDYYYTGSFLNKIFQYLTHWEAGGTTTTFARISIIFGNPNWLSLFYLLMFGLYAQFGGRNVFIFLISILVIFLLQTKTAIAVSILIPLLIIFSESKSIKNTLFFSFILFAISICIFLYWNDIVDYYYSVLELSSFINRQRLFDFISPYIQIYPNGLIGEGSKNALILVSNEDSMPSLFLVLRLLGLPLTILLICYAINPFRQINVVHYILILMSITQSFLSISGACSLVFFSIFITNLAKNDLYTR